MASLEPARIGIAGCEAARTDDNHENSFIIFIIPPPQALNRKPFASKQALLLVAQDLGGLLRLCESFPKLFVPSSNSIPVRSHAAPSGAGGGQAGRHRTSLAGHPFVKSVNW